MQGVEKIPIGKGVSSTVDVSMSLQQFRRLLDLVYVGNWVLNSARGDDRIVEFDEVESLLFRS